ncbi:hypothetical protein TRFO_20811 [Tritrichomonas foetus]|uniref:Uncharacterized protein n=1 Tax=Tritrichomonas foetus TaxID=1144522 RepID=A0A1J4KJR6_9EUKA|nr:hypothetical protein TRFO_20811 [Tritrichomonas foetus]|eukprot:OHT10076.1 hypothetical protein TRFO_20811 [Tritrichomonas foetus]
MGMNSIGPVLFQMKSKKILTVILLAFFQPAVPMSLFKETFEPLCSSEVLVSENNFAFFLSLINQFRSIAKFDDLIPKPTVKKVTSLKVAKYEVSCKITYSIQLFQNLISDPNFFRILTDFCHTFSIKSETINFDEFRLFMEFWNDENTYIEYIVNVTIVPEIKKAVVYLEQEITKNNEKDENRKEKVGGQDEPIPFMPEKPKFGETEESATRWRRISDAVEEAGTYDDDKDHENIPKELRKSHKTVVQPIPIESKQKLSEIVDIFVDEAGISERSAKIQEETLSHLPSRNEEIEMNTKQEENKEQKGNNNEQENKKETIGGQDEPIPFNSEKIFEPSQKVKKWHRISDAIENGPQYDDSEDVENISKELRKTHKTQIVQPIHEKVNKSTEIEDEFVDEDGIIERTIQLTEELNIQPAHEENKSVEIKNGVEPTKNVEESQNESDLKFGGQNEPVQFESEKVFFPNEKKERWHRISDSVEEKGKYDDSEDLEHIPKELRKSHKTQIISPSTTKTNKPIEEIEDEFVDEAGIISRSIQLEEESSQKQVQSQKDEIKDFPQEAIKSEIPKLEKEESQNTEESQNESDLKFGGQNEPVQFESEKVFFPNEKKERWHRISDSVEEKGKYDDSEDLEHIPKELRKSHKTQIISPSTTKTNKPIEEIEDEFVDEAGIISRSIQLEEESSQKQVQSQKDEIKDFPQEAIKSEIPKLEKEESQNTEESQNESDLKFGGQNEPVQFESEKVFFPNEKKERWHRISDSVEEKGKYDDSEDLEHIPKELRKSHKTQIISPSTTKTNKPIEEIEDEFVDEAGIISRSIQLEEELETEENIEDERNSEEKPIKQTSERRTKDQNKPKPSRKERVAARVAREAAAAENALKDEENQENSKTNKLPPKPKGNNPYANIASALGITEVPKSTNNQFQQHQGTPVQQKKPVDRHDTPVQPKKVPTNKQDTPVQQKKQAANRQDTPIQQKTIPLIRKDTPIQQKNVPYVPANAVSWGELKLDPNGPS